MKKLKYVVNMMLTNYSYKQLAYLLGCYVVTADKEINEHELNVLDSYLDLSDKTELHQKRTEIFADDETCINEKDLYNYLRLKNLSNAEKEEIVDLIVRVAYGDNFVSRREYEIIGNVSKALNIDVEAIINREASLSDERIEKLRLSKLQRIVGTVENTLYDVLNHNSKEKLIDWLLGSLGYSTAIEDITNNAIVDFDRVSRIIGDINADLKTANDKLAGAVKEKISSKDVSEVVQIVQSISVDFQEMLNTSLVKNVEVLEKKKRNIRYFTIAFMGRTKAGKSTLHKVITQQDNDDIGVGRLRTTRFNRSWYWNLLRVVDTPGIGAPGGDVDTEIAKSIIDEADIICYVVTSDSIQETEFDFFETIKERNKPLYIILNVKSNLNQSVRLKRFLDNPLAWREDGGPQAIGGHISRIHDKLDGKYNMDAIEIIPMHLLAAQLGLSGEFDEQTSKLLIEGSNIITFTRSVKSEVHKSGDIKKSLSVIDGTAYQINTMCSMIEEDCKQLNDGVEALKQKRDKFKKFIDTENTRLQSDVNTIFEGVRAELHNRADLFARNHYEDKEAGEKWQNDEVVKSKYSKLNHKLEARMNDFSDKAKAEMEELASDIEFLFNAPQRSDGIKGESITNTRLGVGIIGSIITAVAPFAIANIWNPAGWVVALGAIGVGLVVSFITSLFTSKAEKIRKSTEKLKGQLDESIDNSIDSIQSDALASTEESVAKMYKSINDILSAYILNVQNIVKQLQSLIETCRSNEDSINSLIGLRILEFAGVKQNKKKINAATNTELAKLFPVKRDWREQSLTYLYDIPISENKRQNIEQATQMKILRS